MRVTAQNSATDKPRIPALLLVGGLGTRLRSLLPATPKALAPVGGAPFLELLVTQLRAQGIRHLVMCTGHLADQIEQRFGGGRDWNLNIDYSKETQPLGTAGAIKLAEHLLKDAADFLVMNGDSFLEVDFQQLIRFHHEHGGVVSMAVRNVPNAARYGTVRTNQSNRIIAFAEKRGLAEPGLISGGVYVFKRCVLEHIPDGQVSLEVDVFPSLLEEGMFAMRQDGLFIDIGTPEDYARAQSLCRDFQQITDARSR